MLSSVSEALTKPVCFTLTPFDARSEVVRTQESGLGNWIADVLRHAYAESIVQAKDKEGGLGDEYEGDADAAILCGGTLRGDSQYGPGKISLGDILGELPEAMSACILRTLFRNPSFRRSRCLHRGTQRAMYDHQVAVNIF